MNGPEAWSTIFNSDKNWTGFDRIQIGDRDRLRIQRHEEVIGAPTPMKVRGDKEWAADIAQRVHSHWGDVRKRLLKRFKGGRIAEVVDGYYIAVLFGVNCYCEGTSGVGKTAVLRALTDLIDIPFSTYDARNDTSDLELIGREFPFKSTDGSFRYQFQSGYLTRPGIMGILIDELPRLPGPASNSLLQAMVERVVRLNLTAQGVPDHEVRLSPNFVVIGTGNPVGYGAQGERSRALFDRFGIGVEAGQPSSTARVQMYSGELIEPDELTGDPMSDPTPPAQPAISPNPELGDFARRGFTIRDAHTALRHVRFRRNDDNLTDSPMSIFSDHFKLLEAASAAVSPKPFRERVGWSLPDNGRRGHRRSAPDADFYLDDFRKACKEMDRSQKRLERLVELENRVEKNLEEGSNPRGELATIKNARILRLLDEPGTRSGQPDTSDRLLVQMRHLQDAFRMANLARLKPYPGCEQEVRGIVETAADLFFPIPQADAS